jgi:hypothetical protein
MTNMPSASPPTAKPAFAFQHFMPRVDVGIGPSKKCAVVKGWRDDLRLNPR